MFPSPQIWHSLMYGSDFLWYGMGTSDTNWSLVDYPGFKPTLPDSMASSITIAQPIT